MSVRIFGAAGRLAYNIGAAAARNVSDAASAVTNLQISAAINRAADMFEPVIVPVRCLPRGWDINNYELDADMAELEQALSAPTEEGVPRAEAVARSVRRTVAALERLVAGTNDQEGGRVAELLAELTASATQLREITEDIKAVTAKVRSFFGQ